MADAITSSPLCRACGAPMAPDAPRGLCPACLLAQGLGAPEVSPTNPLAQAFTPPSPAELAERFPQLEILELLGQGGMGAVYKARQRTLDRLVALKILPPGASADPAFAARFEREAKAMARLAHPNIVMVLDFGEVNGLHYLMMEYVDGLNLRQAIRSRVFTPDQALAVVPQICEALQYAHDEGIVHRDIKPENVLLDKKGRVKIADFGLAKLLGISPVNITLTASHQVMGTLHYMAPEQIERPQQVDHRADIYSLGVVFYELLTGELPLGRFALPSEKSSSDARLDQVVLKTLEREPNQRYQHASEVKTAVERISRPDHGDHTGGDWAPPRVAPDGSVVRPISVPFRIPDVYGGLAAAHGMARFNGRVLALEFEVIDQLFHSMKSGVKDVVIPLEHLVSAVWQPGVFSSVIQLRTDYLKHVVEVPRMERGQVKLAIDRVDRATAERLVTAVNRCLAGLPFDSVAPEPQVPPMSAVGGYFAPSKPNLAPVRIPAMGLTVIGAMNILIAAGMLLAWLNVRRPLDAEIPLVFALAHSVGALLLFLAPQVFHGRSHRLAITACLVGMLPCSFLWPVSLFFSIWLLFALWRPEVRAAFDDADQPFAPHLMMMEWLESLFERPDPRDRVGRSLYWPALGLLTAGGFGFSVGLLAIPMMVVASPRGRAEMSVVLTAIPFGLFGILASSALRRRRAYPMAVICCLLSLPWGLSLPFALWALWVLLRDETRAAFRLGEQTMGQPGAAFDSQGIPPAKPVFDPLAIEEGLRQVRGPGLALILCGLLSVVPPVLFLFLAVSNVPWPHRGPYDDPSTVALILGVQALPVVVFLFLGGLKMRSAELYGLCVIAAIVAMLPCHFGVLIGLPVGLWTLVVLMRPEVKAAFAHRGQLSRGMLPAEFKRDGFHGGFADEGLEPSPFGVVAGRTRLKLAVAIVVLFAGFVLLAVYRMRGRPVGLPARVFTTSQAASERTAHRISYRIQWPDEIPATQREASQVVGAVQQLINSFPSSGLANLGHASYESPGILHVTCEDSWRAAIVSRLIACPKTFRLRILAHRRHDAELVGRALSPGAEAAADFAWLHCDLRAFPDGVPPDVVTRTAEALRSEVLVRLDDAEVSRAMVGRITDGNRESPGLWVMQFTPAGKQLLEQLLESTRATRPERWIALEIGGQLREVRGVEPFLNRTEFDLYSIAADERRILTHALQAPPIPATLVPLP